MTTKKAAKRTAPPASMTIHAQQPLSPETAGALEAAGHAAVSAISSPAPSAPPVPRKRSRKEREEDKPDVELPSDLLDSPERMNFVLLLALLSKANGSAEFESEDFEFDDADFNIVFARSVNGKRVTVSVVSAQSGIIRTPLRGKQTAWPREIAQEYQAPPTPEEVAGQHHEQQPADRTAMLAATTGEMTPQERFLEAGQREMQMPFSVGDTPQTARPMDLGAIAAQAHERVLADESRIAERVEAEGH